jgi:cell division protein FtsB
MAHADRDIQNIHNAIDALVEKLRVNEEDQNFRIDALVKENLELKAEIERLRSGTPPPAEQPAPKKSKAKKPPVDSPNT